MSQKKKETASHRERLMSDEERTQVMSDEEGRLTEVFYDEHQHDVLDATGHHDLTPLLPHDANHEPVHGATPATLMRDGLSSCPPPPGSPPSHHSAQFVFVLSPSAWLPSVLLAAVPAPSGLLQEACPRPCPRPSLPLTRITGATPHRRDPKFYATVLAIEAAINEDIHPKRIVQGSSGSYFCRNRDKKIVGVFKPKDEEPYGPLNPKWGKYFQKNLCCCMYGRACLVANQGYLSEAGASIVDSSLGLNIVPKTKVVRFVSTSFHYSKVTRTKTNAVKNASQRFPQIGKRLRQGLPPKTGSLQMFVNGYKDATIVLKQLNLEALQPATRAHLQHLFEKLVILDYLTRNTDRGNDNWLIKYVPPAEGEEESIDIAAIDNGLSFPFKHPDEWRSYPYEWQWGPLAKIKFSDHTCAEFLPKIENDDFIEELGQWRCAACRRQPGGSVDQSTLPATCNHAARHPCPPSLLSLALGAHLSPCLLHSVWRQLINCTCSSAKTTASGNPPSTTRWPSCAGRC